MLVPKLKPQQNPPLPKPAPPAKANKQQWRSGFQGKTGELEFFINIERKPDGHIHARYWVTPGNKNGWEVVGTLREDNTFILKGTENSAEFSGQFTDNGTLINTSFQKRELTLPQLQLTPAPMRLPPPRIKPQQPATATPTPTTPATATSEATPATSTPAPGTTEDPQHLTDAIHALAKKMGKPHNPQLIKIHGPMIQNACREAGITDPNQIAYVFATAVWESDGFQSFTEKYARGWTAEEYFEQAYGPNPTKTLPKDARRLARGESAAMILKKRRERNLKELGNTNPGDGYKYRGRGYVHITGRANYERAQKEIVAASALAHGGTLPNIVENPDLAALDHQIAALIMAKGMATGIFTGQRLSNHINSSNVNFESARSIINGQDQAKAIKNGAEEFNSTLNKPADVQDGDPIGGITEIDPEQKREIRKIPLNDYTNSEKLRIETGIEIGSLNGVASYYNGSDESEDWNNNYSDDGKKYYGYKWQCVEFVRRFTHINSGKYITHRGNARTFFKDSTPDGSSTFDGFTQHRNRDIKTGKITGSATKPKIGDIIVLNTKTYGHVAIVAEVSSTSITIAQQNVNTEFTRKINMEFKDNRWIIGGDVLCWLSQ